MVVRYGDVKDPCEFLGRGLQFGCCATSVHNVCKSALQRESQELSTLHNEVMGVLNSQADQWGKDRCNSVSVLVLAECSAPDGSTSRHIGLLARAWFKPKFQLWAVCDVDGDAIDFPWLVRLLQEPCRLCPGASAPMVRTTAQFAEAIARSSLGGRWEIFELGYQLPAEAPHLLTMMVDRKALLPRRTPRRPQAASRAMLDLRSAMLEPGDAAFPSAGRDAMAARGARGRGRGSRRGAGRGAGAARRAPMAPLSGLSEAPVADPSVFAGSGADTLDFAAIVDEIPVDPFDGFDPADVAEMLEDQLRPPAAGTRPSSAQEPDAQQGLTDDEAAATLEECGALLDGGSGVASQIELEETRPSLPEGPLAEASSSRAAPAGTGPARDACIVGPSATGYFRDTRSDRSVARITGVFGTSVSMKCYLHAKCSVAMAEWKLPAAADIRRWIADAEPIAPTDTDSMKADKAAAHMAAMRKLASSATKPGRTRQGLIDEAAASEFAI